MSQPSFSRPASHCDPLNVPLGPRRVGPALLAGLLDGTSSLYVYPPRDFPGPKLAVGIDEEPCGYFFDATVVEALGGA